MSGIMKLIYMLTFRIIINKHSYTHIYHFANGIPATSKWL